jgi:hypothetical protein
MGGDLRQLCTVFELLWRMSRQAVLVQFPVEEGRGRLQPSGKSPALASRQNPVSKINASSASK